MTRRHRPTPAKLTRPRLRDALARTRLFALLDESLGDRRIAYIIGPPGAGKTTLVASWLNHHALEGIWYELDAGDLDPATFFHYLSVAACSRAALPVLRPEYLGDVPGFARRYFRQLFSRLPMPSVIVLDNFQEAAAGLKDIVASALEEVPDHCRVVIVSREEMPSSFARLRANAQVAVVDWDALRLNTQETEDLARKWGMRDSNVESLRALSQGWVAALRLCMESGGWPSTDPWGDGTRTRDAIFDYFATQVFDRLPDTDQRALETMAILPFVSADMAASLTGDDRAGTLLDQLYRRQLFVQYRTGAHAGYQFHPLFRDFLRNRATTNLTPMERARHQRMAGVLCEAAGLQDDAMEIHLQSEQWHEAARLLLDRADALIEQGRAAVLLRWIDCLPIGVLDGCAPLRFVHGQILLAKEPQLALERFAQAHALYETGGEVAGRIRCAAGSIDAIFNTHANHALMDAWWPMLRELLTTRAYGLEPEVSLRAHASLLIALLFRAPGDSEIVAVAKTVAQQLNEKIPASVRMTAVTQLMLFCTFAGQFELAQVALAHGERIVRHESITPFGRANWLLWRSYLAFLLGDYTVAIEAADTAGRIGDEEGLPGVRFLSAYFLAMHHSRKGTHAQARLFCERVHALRDRSRKLQLTLASACSAWLAVNQNDGGARAHGEIAMRMARELGWPSARIHYGVPYLFGLAESGDVQEAQAVLKELRALTDGTVLACFEALFQAAEARLAERAGETGRAREIIVRLWTEAEASNRGRYLAWIAPWMARFSAWGLEDNPESETIPKLITAFGWGPGPAHLEAWPRFIRIYTLGRFDVMAEGSMLSFGRKAPRKPLALLKLLLAQSNASLAQSVILDTLWPDEEGDAAERALDIALHRLRKWLGRSEAIIQRDGKLTLNAQHVWVDTWSFIHLDDELVRSDLPPVERRVMRALNLYRGAFLADESQPWAMSMRTVLQARYIDVVSRLGAHMETAGRLEEAIALYKRGIGVDALAEPLYRALMRCHLNQGQATEALHVYRNLRQLLSVVLGISPSHSTQALYRQLQTS